MEKEHQHQLCRSLGTPECPTGGQRGHLTLPPELTLPCRAQHWHGQGPFVVGTCPCRRWEGASGALGSGHGATGAAPAASFGRRQGNCRGPARLSLSS